MSTWLDDLFGGRDKTTEKGDHLSQTPAQAEQSKASGSDYPHYTQLRDGYARNEKGLETDNSKLAGSWHESNQSGGGKTSFSYDENHPINDPNWQPNQSNDD